LNSLECNGAATPVMTSLGFTVTSATVADLSMPNSNGNAFFADVLGPTAVPEPTTIAMLGLGFLGLCAIRRNKTT